MTTFVAALAASCALLAALALLCTTGAPTGGAAASALACAAWLCLPCGPLPSLASTLLLPVGDAPLGLVALGLAALSLWREAAGPGERRREAAHMLALALVLAVCARYAWLRGVPAGAGWLLGQVETHALTPLPGLARGAGLAGALLLALAALPWGLFPPCSAAQRARRWLYAALWLGLFAPASLPDAAGCLVHGPGAWGAGVAVLHFFVGCMAVSVSGGCVPAGAGVWGLRAVAGCAGAALLLGG